MQKEETNESAPRDRPDGRGVGLRRAIVGTLLSAVVSLVALTLLGDIGQMGDAFRSFDWRLAPLILGLTAWNYAWRFLKWLRYLRALDVPPLGLRIDLLVYLSGYSLTVTPGKVGELIRTVYLRRLSGAPPNRTAAAIAAERITDGAAMLILALVGLLQFSYGRPFVALALLAFVAGIILIQRPALLHALLNRLAGVPIIGGGIAHARAFLDASHVLFRPRLLGQAIGLGVISWAGECLAFFFVLIGLGMNATWSLLLGATFILALSSLAGGASMMPGGLGITDATVAGMLILLIDDPSMNRTVAAAATLIIRFATLWFAVLIGAIALALLERIARQHTDSGLTTVAQET
jgi:uncharacterized membrane protein YbhN (UPF0104 family)